MINQLFIDNKMKIQLITLKTHPVIYIMFKSIMSGVCYPINYFTNNFYKFVNSFSTPKKLYDLELLLPPLEIQDSLQKNLRHQH